MRLIEGIIGCSITCGCLYFKLERCGYDQVIIISGVDVHCTVLYCIIIVIFMTLYFTIRRVIMCLVMLVSKYSCLFIFIINRLEMFAVLTYNVCVKMLIATINVTNCLPSFRLHYDVIRNTLYLAQVFHFQSIIHSPYYLWLYIHNVYVYGHSVIMCMYMNTVL